MKYNYFDSNYTVKLIEQKIAKPFIIKNHYSHTYPAGCANLGVFSGEELIGVIVFGLSCQAKMASSIVPILRQSDYYELQRLFVKDCTRTGFESWFIGKSISWLKVNRPNIVMLVSFSDPYHDHTGTVYQATNWIFTGANKGGKVHLDKEGKLVHARTIAKGGVDKSELMEEWRPGKYRYVKFIQKGIDVYMHVDTGEIIRTSDLNKWLSKEKEDGAIYVVRDHNNYLRKYKYNLKRNLKYKIKEYPQSDKNSNNRNKSGGIE